MTVPSRADKYLLPPDVMPPVSEALRSEGRGGRTQQQPARWRAAGVGSIPNPRGGGAVGGAVPGLARPSRPPRGGSRSSTTPAAGGSGDTARGVGWEPALEGPRCCRSPAAVVDSRVPAHAVDDGWGATAARPCFPGCGARPSRLTVAGARLQRRLRARPLRPPRAKPLQTASSPPGM